MRIIVYPHAMEIGGSQLNAIQLAGAVRDRGHEVIVVAEPGPLVETVLGMGLEYVPIPAERRRPSLGVANLLTDLVRARSVDVVHGYEWPPAVEAFYGQDGMASLGVAPRGLWVSGLTMEEIDPRTNLVARHLPLTGITLTCATGSLWALDIGGPLNKIAPAAGP